jgi:probable H4MPT-linked C1 transfer pathway protein
MNGAILGWDVGGANLKVARIEDARSQNPNIGEWPFPLWRHPDRLAAMLVGAADTMGPASAMAVTMTAELADCFATKRDGVRFVLDAFETTFPDVEIGVYGVDGRFRSVQTAREAPHDVAAANWMASATFVARMFSDALFIDVGSTTTDVIPIVNGRVVAKGTSDPARLASGELIYTGLLRTPVCAIVQSVPWLGQDCRVAAEFFANTADVYLWLGRIQQEDCTCDTADGRGLSRAEVGARLARVVCADAETSSADGITVIARHVAKAQCDHIRRGIVQVMERLGSACPRVAVLAGKGAFLARAAAEESGLSCFDAADSIGASASLVAPAVAVAYLFAEGRV